MSVARNRIRLLSLALACLLPGAALAAASIAMVSHADLLARLAQSRIVLLDVRTAEEYAAGHIAGAINIPHDRLANRANELPQDRDAEIAVYCRTGRRSAQALEWLGAQGYRRLLHVEGDFLGWQAAGQPVVAGSAAR